MKIVHLQLSKKWGGGGVQMFNLHKELLKANPEVKNTFFCLKNSELHKRCVKNGYHFITVSMKTKLSLFAVLKFIKNLKEEPYDIIHIHGSTALTFFALANVFYKTPPGIFHKKTSFPIKNKKFTLYKYNHKNLKKIITISNRVKEICKFNIKNHSRLTTIYDGTNISEKNIEGPFNIKEKLRLNKDVILVGNIANHIKAKDLGVFIDVAHHIVNKKNEKDYHFVQIGRKSGITNQLIDTLKTYKLDEHVTLLGEIPNASSLLQQFDCFLMTSKSEGGPLVVFESIYYKVPVVSTDTGVTPELIENNVNGFITPIGDSKSLGDGVLKITKNPDIAAKFIEKSYQKLIPDFTTETMAQNVLALYKLVLKENT